MAGQEAAEEAGTEQETAKLQTITVAASATPHAEPFRLVVVQRAQRGSPLRRSPGRPSGSGRRVR